MWETSKLFRIAADNTKSLNIYQTNIYKLGMSQMWFEPNAKLAEHLVKIKYSGELWFTL